MIPKERLPLYDAMVRLFAVAMPSTKVSAQLLGHIMNIPYGTLRKVIDGCPLPAGVKITKGGHRGMEEFITQPTFVSRVDRAIQIISIIAEPIWGDYGITLTPDADAIIAEAEKVIENVCKKLTGSNYKKEFTIVNGNPKIYRMMWFAKDFIQGDYHNTVQEAIGQKAPSIPAKPVHVALKPSLGVYKPPHEPVPPASTPFDRYSIVQFVNDIQGLITSKEQYIGVIKRMEEKINREYPALIAQKEAEKATAEKKVGELRERVKNLEALTAAQTEEITNLKKHPKFARHIKDVVRKHMGGPT